MPSRELEEHFREERDKAVQELIEKREAYNRAKEDIEKNGPGQTDTEYERRLEKMKEEAENAAKQAKAWSDRAQGKPAARS